MNEKLLPAGKMMATVASVVVPIPAAIGSFLLEAALGYEARKTNKFMADVESRLRALEATGVLAVNDLIEREGFLDLLLTSAEVARRTRRKEKIERIKRAIIFCAVNNPKAEETDSFFHLLDQLTEEHFVVLAVLAANLDAFAEVKTFQQLYQVFCEYNTSMAPDVFGHYLYDLNSRRLLRVSETIEDEDGIAAHDHRISFNPNRKKLPKIVISDVAWQLLDVTTWPRR